MSARPLTARGVKSILGRAKVDYSGLEITDTNAGVKIAGPEGLRARAHEALYGRGLSCAPYIGFSYWMRLS